MAYKSLQKKTYSIRSGSFFAESKLDLWQILALSYFWCTGAGSSRGLSQQQLKKELEINSNHTIVDWKQFCRDVTVQFFANGQNFQLLGGVGAIIEIDESCFSRRKYHRGRILPNQWVFGMYDIQTKHGALIPLPDRSTATL